jgi:serine/threonine protein kinase
MHREFFYHFPFNNALIIGTGEFGNVYKVYIDDGTTPFAIKWLKSRSQQGAHEFHTDVAMLSQLRHRHLVSLIGYCNDDRKMILVYDYMSRGSLCDHLYDTDNPPISWKQRLEVCIGATRGLQYLHTDVKHVIIHCDMKTTKILLDEKWMAKVSYFGLAKIRPNSLSKTHESTVVKGSIGYMAPKYYQLQQLTEKSDVYSFGVVLCEVLCAQDHRCFVQLRRTK